ACKPWSTIRASTGRPFAPASTTVAAVRASESAPPDSATATAGAAGGRNSVSHERTARRSTSAAGVSGSRNGGPLTPRYSPGPPRSPTPDPGPSNGTTGAATAGRPRPETAGAPDFRRHARPGGSPEYAR